MQIRRKMPNHCTCRHQKPYRVQQRILRPDKYFNKLGGFNIKRPVRFLSTYNEDSEERHIPIWKSLSNPTQTGSSEYSICPWNKYQRQKLKKALEDIPPRSIIICVSGDPRLLIFPCELTVYSICTKKEGLHCALVCMFTETLKTKTLKQTAVRVYDCQ